jgi:hypothetical protein
MSESPLVLSRLWNPMRLLWLCRRLVYGQQWPHLLDFGTAATAPGIEMADTALKTFSLENDVLEISPQDEIYKFDSEEAKRIDREAPWSKESVSISTNLLSSVI